MWSDGGGGNVVEVMSICLVIEMSRSLSFNSLLASSLLRLAS